MDKTKRFAVIENIHINPETGSGRSAWYGEFETREEAEKYIADSKQQNVGILDLEDAIVKVEENWS